MDQVDLSTLPEHVVTELSQLEKATVIRYPDTPRTRAHFLAGLFGFLIRVSDEWREWAYAVHPDGKVDGPYVGFVADQEFEVLGMFQGKESDDE